jgi:hypothetical protein
MLNVGETSPLLGGAPGARIIKGGGRAFVKTADSKCVLDLLAAKATKTSISNAPQAAFAQGLAEAYQYEQSKGPPS